MLIEIHTFSFKKIHLKISSGKWRPLCLGLNVLNQHKSRKGWRYGRETRVSCKLGEGVGFDYDNGLAVRCQIIIWTNAGLIVTGPLGTYMYLSDQSNFHSRKSIENVVCKTEAILSRSQYVNNNNNNNNDNNNDNNLLIIIIIMWRIDAATQSLDTDMQRLFYSTWLPSFSSQLLSYRGGGGRENDGGRRIKRVL